MGKRKKMRNRIKFWSILWGFQTLLSVPLGAQVLKIGTMIPQNSSWEREIKKLGQRWNEVTEGRVRFRVYSGGVVGGEADMIRKMRIGQLDGAVLTSIGLSSIVPQTLLFSLPFFLEDEKHLDYALKNLVSVFDEDFRKKNFEMIGWTKTGWVYLYTKKPEAYTAERFLKGQRLSVGEDNLLVLKTWKQLGIQVVPVKLADTLISLQSGMSTAFIAPPLGALVFQWFTAAPYMIDFPIAPSTGGFVVNRKIWRRIPKKYHRKLKEVSREFTDRFGAETRKANEDALDLMKKNQLRVLPLSSEEKKAWVKMMKQTYQSLVGRGKSIPESLYRDIQDKLSAVP